MRCLACDKELTDYEATRKFVTGHYVDLCNHCYFSGVHQMVGGVIEREDLQPADADDKEEDIDFYDE